MKFLKEKGYHLVELLIVIYYLYAFDFPTNIFAALAYLIFIYLVVPGIVELVVNWKTYQLAMHRYFTYACATIFWLCTFCAYTIHVRYLIQQVNSQGEVLNQSEEVYYLPGWYN